MFTELRKKMNKNYLLKFCQSLEFHGFWHRIRATPVQLGNCQEHLVGDNNPWNFEQLWGYHSSQKGKKKSDLNGFECVKVIAILFLNCIYFPKAEICFWEGRVFPYNKCILGCFIFLDSCHHKKEKFIYKNLLSF